MRRRVQGDDGSDGQYAEGVDGLDAVVGRFWLRHRLPVPSIV
jgi:hypothetical protein